MTKDAMTGEFPRRRHTPAEVVSRTLGRWMAPLWRHLGIGCQLYRRHLEGTQVSQVDIEIPGLDPIFDGYRIAHISDIHAGLLVDHEALSPLIETIREFDPDLVAISGDFVAYGARDLPRLVPALEKLEARDGLYGCLGNHDYYDDDVEDLVGQLRSSGVEILINESVRIQRSTGGSVASFLLVGLDDLEEGHPCLKTALADRRASEPIVLLSHQPDTVAVATRYGVALQLSGHTHGGQIVLPLVGALKTSTTWGFLSGAYEVEGTKLYVTRGIGAVMIPLRIGCPPELPLIRLHPSRVEVDENAHTLAKRSLLV